MYRRAGTKLVCKVSTGCRRRAGATWLFDPECCRGASYETTVGGKYLMNSRAQQQTRFLISDDKLV